MNPDREISRPASAQSISLAEQHSFRPILFPMLGAATGILYVLIHNLLLRF